MKTIKNLIVRYRELIVYVLAGGLTTAVNIIVFALCNLILGKDKHLVSNVIAWILSVAFAYVINKIWVFQSKSWERRIVLKEIPNFVSGRIFSFLVEELGLYLLVDVALLKNFNIAVLSFDVGGEMIAKIIMAVIVVILNYVISKLVVFKSSK